MRQHNHTKLWFVAKRYGWGWVPITWQGWLVTLAYIVFIILAFRRVDGQSHSASDTLIGMFPALVIATLVLLWICYEKGEQPRWRWGN